MRYKKENPTYLAHLRLKLFKIYNWFPLILRGYFMDDSNAKVDRAVVVTTGKKTILAA